MNPFYTIPKSHYTPLVSLEMAQPVEGKKRFFKVREERTLEDSAVNRVKAIFDQQECQIIHSKEIPNFAANGTTLPPLVFDFRFTLHELIQFLNQSLNTYRLGKEFPWLHEDSAIQIISGLPSVNIEICYCLQENIDLQLFLKCNELDYVESIIKTFLAKDLPGISSQIDSIFPISKLRGEGFLIVKLGNVVLKFILKPKTGRNVSLEGLHIPLIPNSATVSCNKGTELFDEHLKNVTCRKMVLKNPNTIFDLTWKIANRMSQGFSIESDLSFSLLSKIAWNQLINDYPCNTPSEIERFQKKANQVLNLTGDPFGKISCFINLLYFLSMDATSEDRLIYIKHLIKSWKGAAITGNLKGLTTLEPFIKLIELDPKCIHDLLACVQGIYLYLWATVDSPLSAYTFEFSENPQTARLYVSNPGINKTHYVALSGSPVEVAKNWLVSWERLAQHFSKNPIFETYFPQLVDGLGLATTKENMSVTIQSLANAFNEPRLATIMSQQYKGVSLVPFYDFVNKLNIEGLDSTNLKTQKMLSSLRGCSNLVIAKNAKISNLLNLLFCAIQSQKLSVAIETFCQLFQELQRNVTDALYLQVLLKNVLNDVFKYIQSSFKNDQNSIERLIAILNIDSKIRILENPLSAQEIVLNSFTPAFLNNVSLTCQYIQLLQNINGLKPILNAFAIFLEHPESNVEMMHIVLKHLKSIEENHKIALVICKQSIVALIKSCCSHPSLRSVDIFAIQDLFISACKMGLITAEQAVDIACSVLERISPQLLNEHPNNLFQVNSFIKKLLLEVNSSPEIRSNIKKIRSHMVEPAILHAEQLLKNSVSDSLSAEHLYYVLKTCQKAPKKAIPICLKLTENALKSNDEFLLRQAFEIVLLALKKEAQFGLEQSNLLIDLSDKLLGMGSYHKNLGFELITTLENTTSLKAVQIVIRAYIFQVMIKLLLLYRDDKSFLMPYLNAFLRMKICSENVANQTIPMLLEGLFPETHSMVLEGLISIISDLDPELSPFILTNLPVMKKRMDSTDYAKLICHLITEHENSGFSSEFMPRLLTTKTPNHPLLHICNQILVQLPLPAGNIENAIKSLFIQLIKNLPKTESEKAETDHLIIQTFKKLNESQNEKISDTSLIDKIVVTLSQCGILWRSEIVSTLFDLVDPDKKNSLYELIYWEISEFGDVEIFEWALKHPFPFLEFDYKMASQYVSALANNIKNIALKLEPTKVIPYARHIESFHQTVKSFSERFPTTDLKPFLCTLNCNTIQVYLRTKDLNWVSKAQTLLSDRTILAFYLNQGGVEFDRQIIMIIKFLQDMNNENCNQIARDYFETYLAFREQRKIEKLGKPELFPILKHFCEFTIGNEHLLLLAKEYLENEWTDTDTSALTELIITNMEGYYNTDIPQRVFLNNSILNLVILLGGVHHQERLRSLIIKFLKSVTIPMQAKNVLSDILVEAEKVGTFPMAKMQADKTDSALRKIAMQKLLCDSIYLDKCLLSEPTNVPSPQDCLEHLMKLYAILDDTNLVEMQIFLNCASLVFKRIYICRMNAPSNHMEEFCMWIKKNIFDANLHPKIVPTVLQFWKQLIIRILGYPEGLKFLKAHTKYIDGKPQPVPINEFEEIAKKWEWYCLDIKEILKIWMSVCLSENMNKVISSYDDEKVLQDLSLLFSTILGSEVIRGEIAGLEVLSLKEQSLGMIEDKSPIFVALIAVLTHYKTLYPNSHSAFVDRLTKIIESNNDVPQFGIVWKKFLEKLNSSVK